MAGYSGSNYDRYAQRADSSTTHKLRSAYWSTKQAVMKRLGRPEDEHVVASDAELDAKLDLFRSIQRTCTDLLRIIEHYQSSLCGLSQSENEFGRFLKSRSEHSAAGKTSAGKMMSAVGKSLSFSAQQRLALRVPLGRLHQEVETFRCRAITDTLLTVQRMEAARTDYRGALRWMRKVSEELDPDACKQLERFRSVQAQVRKCKSKFDKLKLDCMQKVDLLAASRCNLLSHVLALYQDILMQFWAKTSRTMAAVADSFKGYQFYEFNMLKDLVDESRKLASQTSAPASEDADSGQQQFSDCLDQKLSRLDEIFLQELHNEPTADANSAISTGTAVQSETAAAATNADGGDGKESSSPRDRDGTSGDLFDCLVDAPTDVGASSTVPATDSAAAAAAADTAGEPPEDDAFLRDLLDGGSSDLASEWGSAFGAGSAAAQAEAASTGATNWDDLLPAALQNWKTPQQQQQQSVTQQQQQPIRGVGQSAASGTALGSQRQSAAAGSGREASAWFSLFAELDPLSNPDLISKKSGQISDA